MYILSAAAVAFCGLVPVSAFAQFIKNIRSFGK